MITGMEHVGLCATDTTALKNWYVNLFGWAVVYDNAKSPSSYFLRMAEGQLLEIYPAQKPGLIAEHNFVSGWRHIALGTDDVAADAEKIIAAGATVESAVKITESGVGTFFFRDPEGNVVHLIQRRQPL